MAKHTITLDGLMNVTKGPRDKTWTATVAMDWDKVPAHIIPLFTEHGAKQKLADAASGAKDKAEAEGAMFKALDAIYAGEWSSRGSGEGLGDVRSIAIHRLFRAALPDDAAKRFRKLSTSDQVRKAIEQAAAFDDADIAAEIDKIEAERQAKRDADDARKASVAKLAGKVTIDF